ncbi:hypothetical protein HHI36_018557 [Cryptolaemus montrouzieri]|uniref:Proteasome assembly chaperone 2 n=1 Tax=Cryptolaemus montrouzieri TaxID=559131 RepID=A0ABD2P0C2_9CUCU
MTMFKWIKHVNLNGFTLIIPSISVGNVPQLTVDLLISNFNFQKTGIIWHPAIVCSVGADPFNETSEDICTACELYTNESLQLAVIQLRTTLEFRLVTKFFDDLKTEILEHKIANIIILSSGYDYELHLIDRGKYFYIDSQGTKKELEQNGVIPIEPDNGKYTVHGGGYSVTLFEFLKGVCHCTLLVKYVSEGDNRPDAISVMQVLYKFIEGLKNASIDNVIYPYSWAYVFGGPPPIGMY